MKQEDEIIQIKNIIERESLELIDIDLALNECKNNILSFIKNNIKSSFNIEFEVEYKKDNKILDLIIKYNDCFMKVHKSLSFIITKKNKIIISKRDYHNALKLNYENDSIIDSFNLENEINNFFIYFINHFKKNDLNDIYLLNNLFDKKLKLENNIKYLEKELISNDYNNKINSILNLLTTPLTNTEVNNILNSKEPISFCHISLNHLNKVELIEYSIETSGYSRITYYLTAKEKKVKMNIKDLKNFITNSIKYKGKVIHTINQLLTQFNQKEYNYMYGYTEFTIEEFLSIFHLTLKIDSF